MFFLKWIYFVPLLSLSACAFFQKETAGKKSADSPLQKAIQALDKDQFQVAFDILDEQARIETHPQKLLPIYYYRGLSLEGLNQWEEAITSYRMIVGLTIEGDWSARALYRLSHCFEAMGDDAKTMAALKDLEKRKKNISEEVRLAELPGRLAATYARLGDERLARQYFQKAEAGLKKLKVQSEQTASWYPRTLFEMGRVMQTSNQLLDAERLLRQMEVAQVYLMRSIEIGDVKWSAKAFDELKQNYQNLWKLIQTGAADAEMSKREADEMRILHASQLLEVLELGRLDWSLQREDKNPHLSQTESFIAQMKTELNQYLQTHRVGSELTEEAKQRESIFRPGRIISETTVLEIEAQKRRPNQKRKKGEK